MALLTRFWNGLKTFGRHCLALSGTFLIAAVCLGVFLATDDGQWPPPWYVKAAWTMFKITMAVAATYLILLQTAGYIRLGRLTQQFEDALRDTDPGKAIAIAIFFAGAALMVGILSHAIIPSIAQW